MSDITVPASIAMGIYALIYLLFAVLAIGYYRKGSKAIKRLIVTIVVIAVVVGLIWGLGNINPNRLGTDSYYVQITNSGDTIEDKISTGEVMVRYEYTLLAFDKKGNKKELTFTSGHELRKDAYINLFLKDDKGVTSYQEVQKEEIPEKALNKLKR